MEFLILYKSISQLPSGFSSVLSFVHIFFTDSHPRNYFISSLNLSFHFLCVNFSAFLSKLFLHALFEAHEAFAIPKALLLKILVLFLHVFATVLEIFILHYLFFIVFLYYPISCLMKYLDCKIINGTKCFFLCLWGRQNKGGLDSF